MSINRDDFIDLYKLYLSKFEDLFGELDHSEVVAHKGTLIKKLSYEDFVDKWSEFKRIELFLREVMSTGATLNNEINKTYKELSSHLLETPKNFVLL